MNTESTRIELYGSLGYYDTLKGEFDRDLSEVEFLTQLNRLLKEQLWSYTTGWTEIVHFFHSTIDIEPNFTEVGFNDNGGKYVHNWRHSVLNETILALPNTSDVCVELTAHEQLNEDLLGAIDVPVYVKIISRRIFTLRRTPMSRQWRYIFDIMVSGPTKTAARKCYDNDELIFNIRIATDINSIADIEPCMFSLLNKLNDF